jgi:hypothetical protein
MTNDALNDLRCDIVGSAANSTLFLLCKLKLRCETKVTHLKFHIGIYKDVAHFQVPVDNTMTMHILDSRDDLVHEIFGLAIGELLATF